jgi:hypothetical protein
VHTQPVELEPVRHERIFGQGCKALVGCAEDVDAPIFAIVRELAWDQVYARRVARSSLDARAPRGRLLDVAPATRGAEPVLEIV